MLRDKNIQFEIVGTGITYKRDQRWAKELDLNNIRFIDAMTEADCCLGIFGDNPRTLRVLTNKVIETLAVAKPLISAKNKPVQELLKDGESAILINRADPQAIAEAILLLKNKPKLRQRLGQKGYEIYKQYCAMEQFSNRLKMVIERMMAA